MLLVFIWEIDKIIIYLMLFYVDKEILKNVYGKFMYQEKQIGYLYRFIYNF